MATVVRTVLRAGVNSGVLLVALAWLLPLASLKAQTGSVSGVVNDSLTGRPLPESVVRAEGTTITSRNLTILLPRTLLRLDELVIYWAGR